jgi:pimeloyl-ACP methyl ester carboxylesterase
MSTVVAAVRPAAADAIALDPIIAHVASADGTLIGYRRFGSGPALILLHGSASSGAHHTELARLLADSHTVVVPDRRGRGLSGPSCRRAGDELREELDDVAALIAATGARDLFGLSSGACILLNAARSMPVIQRIALFEPPLVDDRSVSLRILRTFDAEMARGRIGAAMVTAMRGAEMGPDWFRRLPKAMTSPLVTMGMRQEARQPATPYATMAELAPTLHNDFAVVAASAGRLDDWRSIDAETMLLGGATSRPYLKRALDDLERALPRARRVELRGVGHEASWNADRGGNPALVAAELRRFFAPVSPPAGT